MPRHTLVTATVRGPGAVPWAASYAPEVAAQIRVGTCSWADEALTKAFYPLGLAGRGAARLVRRSTSTRSRSTRPTTACPTRTWCARWAERTPDGFVMHVKAFGVMTRHPVRSTSCRPTCATRRRSTTAAARAAVARVPRRALPPLPRGARAAARGRQARRHPAPVPALRRPAVSSYDYLEWASEQLGGDTPLVEFRHRAWYEGDQLPGDALAASRARRSRTWSSTRRRSRRRTCRRPCSP